jgi:NAD(P)-dependent dehydrogenase (short-subunit alcohol dehydrogenase family)
VDMNSEQVIADVSGRTALVTGGSSGMGAEIARLLARCGASVAIVGRDLERLQATLSSLEGGSGEALSIAADLTAAGEPDRVVAETVERFGRLDYLVNAAGIFRPALIGDAAATFAEEWAVNVQAVYEISRAALPHIREQKGAVLVITSVSGAKAFPEATGYCTTKGAVEMFVRSLAVEEAASGVRVNAIAPGEIRTGLNERLLEEEDYMKAVIDATPMGRVGEVADIAPAAVFLLSNDSSYITGASLAVDGGWAAS